jgi:ketosteroid isomerase-like protein
MHPNEQLLNTFYTAFNNHDAAGMIACYAPDIVFTDPVFMELHGNEAKAMWQMLAGRSKDLTLVFNNVHANDKTGTAHWEATYTFSSTGRKVLNIIDAFFEFKDGKISRHTDSFDLWKWASQALGPRGQFLGWAPPVQNAIRKTARKGLDAYLQKQGATNG